MKKILLFLFLISLSFATTTIYLDSVSEDGNVYLIPITVSLSYQDGITISKPDNYKLSESFLKSIQIAKYCAYKYANFSDRGISIKIDTQWIKDGKLIDISEARIDQKSGSVMLALAIYFEIIKNKLKDFTPITIKSFTISAVLDENCNILPASKLELKKKVEKYGVKLYTHENFKKFSDVVNYFSDVKFTPGLEYSKLFIH